MVLHVIIMDMLFHLWAPERRKRGGVGGEGRKRGGVGEEGRKRSGVGGEGRKRGLKQLHNV